MVAELTPEHVVKRVGTIASPPEIYTRLDRAIKKPNYSVREVSEIVSEDAVLTARILKLVNSSFYVFRHEIETVSKAVVLLGTEELRNLALATTVVTMFDGIPEDLVNMEDFWKHSLACGIAARELARCAGQVKPERFFIAGLLHDVGKLALYIDQGDLAREALANCRDNNELHHRAETGAFGFNHAQVGDALAKAWNLPASYQQAMAFHHGPWMAGPELAAVHVGDIIVNALQFGNSGERLVPPLLTEAWKYLGVSVNLIPPVVRSIETQLADSAGGILS